MNAYLNKITSFIQRLDNETLSALNAISETKVYKKGDFLLQQDEVCRYSFTIQNGIARKFLLNDGKEIVTDFYFKDDIAISFDSYSLQKPSKEFIQTLTDTTVSQIEYASFQTIKNNFPKLVELDLLMTEHYAMWLETRLLEFRTLDATQRYLLLLKDHSAIIQTIPLTYIASYLGISLETLSRIRAKI